MLSCTIDGGYHANNAWVATNNPAGDARYVTDATCPTSGDPLRVMLAGGNSFAQRHVCRAVASPRRRDTSITDY